MTCEQFNNLMHDYLDGLLSDEARQDMDRHVRECPDCLEALSEMKEVLKLLKDLPIEPLPENFEANLHEALVRESVALNLNKASHASFSARFKKWQRGLSYAAAVFLVGVVGLGGGSALLGNLNQKTASAVAMEESLDYGAAQDVNVALSSPQVSPMAPDLANTGAASNDSGRMKVAEGGTPEAPAEGEIAPTGASGTDAFTPGEIKRIQTAQLNLEVIDYQGAVDAFINHVTTFGGYVENSQTGTYTQRIGGKDVTLHEGFMVLRVPNEQFQALLTAIGDQGKVIYETSLVNDVTDQYRDTYQELKNLEVREGALREIMTKAKNVTEIIEVERELSRVRQDINNLGSQLKGWDRLVAMSTIHVNLREVRDTTSAVNPPEPGLMQRAKEAFVNTVNGMIEGFEKLFVGLVGLLPILVPVTLVAGLGLWYGARLRKRKNKA